MEHSLEDDGGPMLHHMIAGAVAGTTEHCGMFPVDTIKVRSVEERDVLRVKWSVFLASSHLRARHTYKPIGQL